jgi:hypothetical protein
MLVLIIVDPSGEPCEEQNCSNYYSNLLAHYYCVVVSETGSVPDVGATGTGPSETLSATGNTTSVGLPPAHTSSLPSMPCWITPPAATVSLYSCTVANGRSCVAHVSAVSLVEVVTVWVGTVEVCLVDVVDLVAVVAGALAVTAVDAWVGGVVVLGVFGVDVCLAGGNGSAPSML